MNAKLICLTSALALGFSAPALAEMNFNRIASFATPDNMADGEDRNRETSPEIIAATADGMRLVYTDSPLGVLGMIDIADPKNPKPLGNIPLDGEPTSVTLVGTSAFVGINMSESYTEPAGTLQVIDIDSKSALASCDLGGQPDSVASAKDGSFVIVAIENERDEDLNDGAIPQLPAGSLLKFDIKDGVADCATKSVIDVTGLADVAPSDPEPEFVDVNSLGETVVTLQENNHHGGHRRRRHRCVDNFSAGSASICRIHRHGCATAP